MQYRYENVEILSKYNQKQKKRKKKEKEKKKNKKKRKIKKKRKKKKIKKKEKEVEVELKRVENKSLKENILGIRGSRSFRLGKPKGTLVVIPRHFAACLASANRASGPGDRGVGSPSVRSTIPTL